MAHLAYSAPDSSPHPGYVYLDELLDQGGFSQMDTLLADCAYLYSKVGHGQRGVTISQDDLERMARATDSKVLLRYQPGQEAPFVAMGTLVWNDSLPGRIARLMHVSVRRHWRGKGLGHAIVGQLEELARERGCKSVEVSLSLDDQKGRGFYTRRGYVLQDTGALRLTF